MWKPFSPVLGFLDQYHGLILGFAALPIAGLTMPGLSTFDQQAELVGRTAATLLLDRINGKTNDRPARIEIPAVLVQRDSTASTTGPAPVEK